MESESEQIPKLEVPEQQKIWEKLKRKAKSSSHKPPDWNPEKGNWLLGTVKRTGEGENNRFATVRISKNSVQAKRKTGEGNYKEVTVQPGEEILLWEVKDLRDFFDKIRAGLKIAVQYTGEIKTSEGHKAKLYDHAIEG